MLKINECALNSIKSFYQNKKNDMILKCQKDIVASRLKTQVPAKNQN